MGVKRESEASFTTTVIEYARLRGWLVTHFRPARVPSGRFVTPLQGDRGFPDLVLVNPQLAAVMVVELKVGRNRPTADQERWLSAFRKAGVRCAVWRPEMWDVIKDVLDGGA